MKQDILPKLVTAVRCNDGKFDLAGVHMTQAEAIEFLRHYAIDGELMYSMVTKENGKFVFKSFTLITSASQMGKRRCEILKLSKSRQSEFMMTLNAAVEAEKKKINPQKAK